MRHVQLAHATSACEPFSCLPVAACQYSSSRAPQYDWSMRLLTDQSICVTRDECPVHVCCKLYALSWQFKICRERLCRPTARRVPSGENLMAVMPAGFVVSATTCMHVFDHTAKSGTSDYAASGSVLHCLSRVEVHHSSPMPFERPQQTAAHPGSTPLQMVAKHRL